MKRILFPLPLVAASVLLLTLGMVGCGDDDDGGGDGGGATTPAGTALTEVNDIENSFTKGIDAVGEQSQTAFDDPAKARQALSAALDAGEAAVTALDSLEPPETAQDEHDGLIGAGEDLVAAVNALLEDLQGLQAGPEFDAFAEEAQSPESELSQAINAGVDACIAMQELATANAVEHIECPEKVE
jgi:hypothetical protein